MLTSELNTLCNQPTLRCLSSVSDKPVLYRKENAEESPVKNIVVGQSHIHSLWNINFSHMPEINIPFDWICQKEGNACSLAQIIVRLLHTANTPMKISAIIWEDSIADLSITDIQDMVNILEDTLKDYPQHKLALPECHMVPPDHELHNKVMMINWILAEFNEKQKYAKYPLYKSVMSNIKNKGLVVRPGKWKKKEDAPTTKLESSAKFNFVKFIRKFHAFGFKDDSSSSPTPIPTH